MLGGAPLRGWLCMRRWLCMRGWLCRCGAPVRGSSVGEAVHAEVAVLVM